MGKKPDCFVLKDSFSAYKPSAVVGAGMGVTHRAPARHIWLPGKMQGGILN